MTFNRKCISSTRFRRW